MRWLFLLLLTFSTTLIAGDCETCHDKAPIPEAHMPVARTSVEICTMCHANEGSDPLFQALHRHGSMGLDCSACHDDVSEQRKVRLKSLLEEGA